MLKLEQIVIQNEDEIIVEMLEPVVYTHVGTIAKSDEKIAREKAEVYYTIAKIVKLHPFINFKDKDLFTNNKDQEHNNINKYSFLLHINDHIIIPRNQVLPIQFPIEGYDSPKLGVINKYNILAGIIDEDKVNEVVNTNDTYTNLAKDISK